MYCRVLDAFAGVPLDTGRLIVSQVASTVLQEHQRRSQERGFDDGEHAPAPLHKFAISAFVAGTRARKTIPARRR
jgi:hypothetical protein